MSLRVGQEAPDFSATAVYDQEFKEITLSGLRGKWVVLFFYPLDLHLYVLLKSLHLVIDTKISQLLILKYLGYQLIANTVIWLGYKPQEIKAE